MNQTIAEGFRALISPIVVIVTGMLVLLLDLGGGDARSRRRAIGLVSIAGLVIAALFAVANLQVGTALPGVSPTTYFGGGMVADHLGGLFCIVLCLAAGLSVGMSGRYLEERGLSAGEFYALLLFSTAGAMVMALSYDLVNVFVGLEVLSVSLYILSGYARRDRRSEESAVKYFLLGAFASGFLLYGTALIYGAVGIANRLVGAAPAPGASLTSFDAIQHAVSETAGSAAPMVSSPLFIVGVALVIVGLGFKAAIVPFHSYAPDVYEGAPTPVTAFMSAAAKIGAFGALVRLFGVLLPAEAATAGGAVVSAIAPFHAVLWGLAAATMIVGNVLAIRQVNVKRMLAYSSVAHAGYILVGVLASTAPGVGDSARLDAQNAVVYYLFTYTFMNLGAFATVIWLGRRGGGREYTHIADYAGLARQQPLAAAAMALFMLSLAGIPPAAGFLAKLYIFTSAVQAGLPGLAVLGLVVSVIGVYYYLNLIVAMYFRRGETDFSEVRGGGAKGAALLSAAATLLFGLVPAGVFAPALGAGAAQTGGAAAAADAAPAAPPRPVPAAVPGTHAPEAARVARVSLAPPR